MKSKSKIEKQIKRKRNPEIVETVIKAKKNSGWLEVASRLSMPRRKKISVNLDKIDRETKEGDTVVVPGKVLSEGKVRKKIRIAGLSFSSGAEKKLKDKGCEVVSILEEIKINPEARGIKIII
jgi:large subunit ribosomal protein L18e